VEQVLSGGVGTSGRGRRWEKGVGGWIRCKYCVHMEKWDPLKLPRMMGGGDKGKWWRGQIQVWYI
jgi:hypothetical protein